MRAGRRLLHLLTGHTVLVTTLEATSTGHSVAQQLFHTEKDTSRPQLASRDDVSHAQPAAAFFQRLHREPARSLPLEEVFPVGSRVLLEAPGDCVIPRSVRAAPKAKNMAEGRGVSPARRSCVSNAPGSSSPLKLLPQTELGGLAVMPPPHRAAERWPSQTDGHPREGFFLWKINFAPKFPQGGVSP